jgi:hypothetical protein
VARAKKTDRAEARRRHRAVLLEQGQGDPETYEAPEERATVRTGRVAGASASSGPTKRVGIFGAMKQAVNPVHYGDDLRYAPTLIFRTKAIWPTVLLSVGGLAFGLTQTDYNSDGYRFAATFVIAPTPLIQPMIAGFLAPRATWLAGIVSALISGACLEVLLIWAYSGHLANMPPGTFSYLSLTLDLALSAVTFGALLGAASGWYKRFLASGALGAQPRNQKRPSSSRPASRRPAPRR